MTEGVIALIAQARAYVRRGAVIEMRLPNGLIIPEQPVVMLSLTEDLLTFLYMWGDHAHGQQVLGIRAGDDGQVLVDGHESQLATISEAWTDDQRAKLNEWLASLRQVSIEFPAELENPDTLVQYEGR